MTPYLGTIECPTLIVAGGSDTVAGAGGSVVMSRQIPNAELHVLDGVGHGVYRDARDQFHGLLTSFLAAAGLS